MAVAAVHVRSWQEGYRGLIPGSALDAMRPQDRAARYELGRRGADGPVTVLALEGDEIRGFATVGHARDASPSGAGELWGLYVDPPSWGRGVGQTLIEHARRWLSQQGFAEAILWVLAGNERAERFYRADGWREDGGRRRGEHWGVMVDERRYRRVL